MNAVTTDFDKSLSHTYCSNLHLSSLKIYISFCDSTAACVCVFHLVIDEELKRNQ